MVGTALLLVGTVFLINLIPIFAPPTWTILVLFRLNSHLPVLPLVLLGALSAASGRYILARMTHRLRGRLKAKTKADLTAAEEFLNRRRLSKYGGMLLFALSPLPSAQLFEAAGLLNLALVPFTLSFFAGRIVSYSLFVAGASTVKVSGSRDVITAAFKSPYSIALQLLLIFGVYLLTKINWVKFLDKHNNK